MSGLVPKSSTIKWKVSCFFICLGYGLIYLQITEAPSEKGRRISLNTSERHIAGLEVCTCHSLSCPFSSLFPLNSHSFLVATFLGKAHGFYILKRLVCTCQKIDSEQRSQLLIWCFVWIRKWCPSRAIQPCGSVHHTSQWLWPASPWAHNTQAQHHLPDSFLVSPFQVLIGPTCIKCCLCLQGGKYDKEPQIYQIYTWEREAKGSWSLI